MGLLDRLRANRPTPGVAIGGSGRMHTGGFLQWDEINARLTGKAGIDIFEKMWRTDADCRRIITMCAVPIAEATYDIEPYVARGAEEPTEKDKEVADFVRWALWESMIPKFPAHVWTATTVGSRSGFAPFEQIYKLDQWNGRQVITIDTLDLRRPRSVDRWPQEGHRLVAIQQYVPGGSHPTNSATIPAEDLVYYRYGAEGDNWEGQSLLRPAYKHWKYKDKIELIDAIGIERFSVGTPIAYPPDSDVGEEVLESVERTLEAMRSADGAYIVAPGPHQTTREPGWHFEILTPQSASGAGERVKNALDHHQAAIDAVVLAEFMRLGQQATGARATADVQQDPFWMLASAIAQSIVADTINEQLIPRLVALNYDVEGFPKIQCSLIDSTSLSELADYASKLAAQKLLRPEPGLEEYLRERAKFPKADEEAIAQQQEDAMKQAQEVAKATADAQPAGPPAKPGAPGAAKPPPTVPPKKLERDEPILLARQTRDLKPFEQTMSLDRIEGAIDSARDRFQVAAGPHARALAVDLAAQARNGKPIKAGRAPAELADAITTQLLALYTTGRDTVREELQRQAPAGITIEAPVQLAASDWLRRLHHRGQAIADAVRGSIATALNRTNVSSPEHSVLQRAAEAAAAAALRAQAQDHAAAALNAGRTDQATDMSSQIEGSRYTAVLDGNVCDDCAAADDDTLRPLDDPVRLAQIPPNPDCQGGPRCRCLEAFELTTEDAAAA